MSQTIDVAANNKMETEPIPKLLVSMSLPPLLSMFMQYSYNFIDSAFVASLSEDALSAVSLSYPITLFMISCSVGLGVGFNVLIATYLGEKKQTAANKTATLGLLLSFVCGIILTLFVRLFCNYYFRLFTNDETLLSLCMEYMSVFAFIQLPNMMHVMVQKIIQATGNMIEPMLFQMAGVVFNFIFDPILIYGLGPFPKMGILGAAISSIGGYFVSLFLALWMLFCTKQRIHCQIKGFTFEIKLVLTALRLGFPSFVMNLLSSVMTALTNIFLTSYSMTAVAFFGAYSKAFQLIVMSVNGIIQGALPLMSFCHGNKNENRLIKSYHLGTILAGGAMAVGGLILALFPMHILSIFSSSDEMLSIGIPAIRIMILGYVFNGISTMIATYLQATKHIIKSLIINLMRQFLVLFPIMWILSVLFGLYGIWISFPVTEFITFVTAYLMQRNNSKKAITLMIK